MCTNTPGNSVIGGGSTQLGAYTLLCLIFDTKVGIHRWEVATVEYILEEKTFLCALLRKNIGALQFISKDPI